MSVGPTVFSVTNGSGAFTRRASSPKMYCSSAVRPLPPYSTGHATPSRPASPSAFRQSVIGGAALHEPGHRGAALGRHDRLEALPVVLAEPLLFGGVVEVHQALAPSRTGIFFTPGTIVARSRVTSPVSSIVG